MTVQEDSSFRTRQAVGDLVHHVGPLLERQLGAAAAASGLSIRAAGEAFGRLRDDGFRFQGETAALRGGLETLALTRVAGFDLAVVLLLADVLQTRQSSGLLDEVWQEARLRLRDWPDTLRAAVANGLRRAVELRAIEGEAPSDADCLTRGAEAIAGPLLRIVRAMRPDELLAVAGADHGQDAERHLAALKADIRQRDGIFQAGETWYPAEVVELTAHGADQPGFEGCSAILLLNALKMGGPTVWFDSRWETLGQAYCGLRPSARDPILAGIRWSYETDREFQSWSKEDFRSGLTIPVVHEVL